MRTNGASNKWILIQLGKDGHYWSTTYSSRKTAEAEGERDLKHGVPYVIVEADKLLNPPAKPRDIYLDRLGYQAYRKEHAIQEGLPLSMVRSWTELSSSEMIEFDAFTVAVREALEKGGEDWDVLEDAPGSSSPSSSSSS